MLQSSLLPGLLLFSELLCDFNVNIFSVLVVGLATDRGTCIVLEEMLEGIGPGLLGAAE